MRKIRTRAFSILLTCAMLLSLLPVTALAGDKVAAVTIGSETTEYESLQQAMDAAAAASMKGEADVEVKLLQDVDLAETEWKSVEVKSITIDGQGHTISNMKVSKTYLESGNSNYGAGFIWKAAGTLTIRDITFDQASICKDSPNNNVIGIVVGYTYGTTVFEDVKVTSSEVYGYGKVGTLLGMGAEGGVSVTFTDCVSTGNTIYAMYDAGGLAGNIQRGSLAEANVTVTGCTVDNQFVQSFLPDGNFKTTETIDTKVTSSDSCALAGKPISGTYLVDGTYYWPAYAEYYCSYGASSHDCALENDKLLLANSEYLVGPVAEIGSVSYSTLEGAITAAGNGDTIKLLDNVTADAQITVNSGKTLTLDLNGKTVTSGTQVTLFKVENGTLKVTGNGTVAAQNEAFRLSGTASPAVLEIGAGVNVTSESDCCVYYLGKNARVDVYGSLTSNGLFATMQGNGTEANWETTTYIHDGASVIHPTGMAIYHPQNGTVIIDNATVSGYNAGIEIRAGELTVNGANITASADTFACNPNGNGSTTSGAAIAIAQHTTKKDISVTITDGTFTGVKALNESNPQGNVPAPQVTLSITGGNFNGEVTVQDVPASGFVTGGTFSINPEEAYLATGYTAVKDNENNRWVVKATNGMVAEVGTPDSNGTVSAEVGGNFSGDENGNNVVTDENGTVTITATTTPSSGATVSRTEVTINNTALTSVANELPSSVANVTIKTDVGTVTLDKEAWDTVTANANGDSVVLSVEENDASMTGWTVTAATPDGDTVFSTEDNPDGTVTISVPYTASGETSGTKTIYYINDNGDLEAFTAQYTAGESGASGTLTWKTGHLSSFVIPDADDEAIWMINGVPTGSGTLADAISATASGDTISLLKDITADNSTLGDTTSAVYVIPNGVNFNGNNHKITAAENWEGDTGTNNHILAVESDGNATVAQTTIQNVTIIGDPNSKSGIHAYNGANVVLKNVNIQNCGSVGVQINGATVNATDLNISGSGWGSINVDQGSGVSVEPKLTFNSGTLSDPSQIYTELKAAGDVSITVSETSGLKQVHSGDSGNLKGFDYYTDDVSKLGVAYNETTNTVYATLEDALREAASGNIVTVVKDTSLTTNAEVKPGVTLVVNPDVTLTISDDKILSNNGTIQNNGTIDGNVTSGSGAVIKSTVTFSVIPSNATIVVTKNGSTVTGNNGVYLLENGTYSYTVSASGYYTQSSTFTVSGNAQAIAVNLRAIPTDSGGGSGSGSGSSTPTYQVSVDKAEGGKITVSPTRAEKGDTVTITVKPDEGYELGKLTVTDKDGDKVTLTQKDDNKYTFKMPAGKVTVKATFTEIEVEPEQPELPFSDVAEQDWFYDAVVYVYENELMNGTSATTFSPSVTTSRAMMLTMLARYDGVDTSTGSTWYEAGAAWAVAEGVSDGTNLEADLTREQLVTMLWRYAGSPMVEKDLPDYPDRDEVSDWAVRAMVWAVDNGIITGNGAGELNPQGSASRAEVATILMRFIQL